MVEDKKEFELDDEMKKEIDAIYKEIDEQVNYFVDVVRKVYPDTPEGMKLRDELGEKIKVLNARIDELYRKARIERLRKNTGVDNGGSKKNE
jgi:hypothetical protein